MAPLVPLYALRDVADLVKQDKISFTPRAERDYRKMGYSREQAKEIIVWLTPSEHEESIRYTDTGMEWDVYLTVHRGPSGVQRELYIKLRIPSPASVDFVAVTSFHPSECK